MTKLDKNQELDMQVAKQTNEKYSPSPQEVVETAAFLNNCSSKDLLESWNRLSSEWDFGSLMDLHRSLSDSGRIFDLVEEVKKIEIG